MLIAIQNTLEDSWVKHDDQVPRSLTLKQVYKPEMVGCTKSLWQWWMPLLDLLCIAGGANYSNTGRVTPFA